MSEYPNDAAIKALLKWHKAGLVITTIFVMFSGAVLEFQGFLPNGVARSGALFVVISLGWFFWLEQREFLTGHRGDLNDSDNHFRPKGEIGPFVTWPTIIGSLTAIFGDLIFPVFTCGGMTC